MIPELRCVHVCVCVPVGAKGGRLCECECMHTRCAARELDVVIAGTATVACALNVRSVHYIHTTRVYRGINKCGCLAAYSTNQHHQQQQQRSSSSR
jgi:hypothetical protein